MSGILDDMVVGACESFEGGDYVILVKLFIV